jgi:hypothetical protein
MQYYIILAAVPVSSVTRNSFIITFVLWEKFSGETWNTTLEDALFFGTLPAFPTLHRFSPSKKNYARTLAYIYTFLWK